MIVNDSPASREPTLLERVTALEQLLHKFSDRVLMARPYPNPEPPPNKWGPVRDWFSHAFFLVAELKRAIQATGTEPVKKEDKT